MPPAAQNLFRFYGPSFMLGVPPITPMKRLFLTFALCGLGSRAAAQDTTAVSWTRDIISSTKLNEQRPIFVATPANYGKSSDRYGVLVLLDANDVSQFTVGLANVRFLTSRGAIPPLIVVGIPNTRDRTHDLTPPPSGGTAKTFPTAGGADAFADFITDEVLPVVRSKYRTRSTTILAGHSFGGLFALHVAANRPGVFTGVIAMSPALWWNDTTDVLTYSSAIAKSAKWQRVFATSGGLEPEIDRATKRFASRLDSLKPASAGFGYRFYAEDGHSLTPAPSLVDGLRFVFEPIALSKSPIARLTPNADSATVVRAAIETEEGYARGARALGLPELLPEGALNQLGYTTLQGLKKPGLAVWVFRRNVALYPESANVYDSLGDGLLAQGDSTGAKNAFRRAVDLATSSGHPVLQSSRDKLQQLEHTVQAGKPKP